MLTEEQATEVQEIINVVFVTQEREGTSDVSAVLVPEGLVLDLVKDYPEKTLAEVGLEQDKDLSPDPNRRPADKDRINDTDENRGRIEKSKNKTSTYYQNPVDMELDEETSTLGRRYRNGVTNTKGLYGQNGSKINTDECKALIHYQRSTDDNEDGKIIFDTESKGSAPGEEGYQELVEREKATAMKLDEEEKKEKSGIYLERETLHDACESWLRKVEEF
ncbi:hypothetical protein F8M41_015649 [Gigaspora margarita]|uniref:Uncharacterized protein n=1 Tax=Gigaspora margarita TaxID=4874 RepID=A0A8H4B378_GIGMA|nr:hypothetical protein F8M41_015649 [Gigaspora margarita]